MGIKHLMVSESKSRCGRQVTQGTGADCKNCARVAKSREAKSGVEILADMLSLDGGKTPAKITTVDTGERAQMMWHRLRMARDINARFSINDTITVEIDGIRHEDYTFTDATVYSVYLGTSDGGQQTVDLETFHVAMEMGKVNRASLGDTSKVETVEVAEVDIRTAQTDLFERARSLGYTDASAADLADSFFQISGITDTCPTHPGLSTTIQDGYAIDQCPACEVVELSTAAGFDMAEWKAREEVRRVKAAETEAGQYTVADCSCNEIIDAGVDMLPANGMVCLGDGSIFTRPGWDGSDWVHALSAAVAKRNRAAEPVGNAVTGETLAEVQARHKRQQFKIGDRRTFRKVVRDRRLWQERPMSCRNDYYKGNQGCVCPDAACLGSFVESEQLVSEVIEYVSGGLEIKGDGGGWAAIRPDRLD